MCLLGSFVHDRTQHQRCLLYFILAFRQGSCDLLNYENAIISFERVKLNINGLVMTSDSQPIIKCKTYPKTATIFKFLDTLYFLNGLNKPISYFVCISSIASMNGKSPQMGRIYMTTHCLSIHTCADIVN